MARRHDIEKIFNELEGIREALSDPATGLAAFHQDLDELRRKVLETVLQGTAGLREENRELRRRQERMLGDLGDTRTAVEALRREIAQAWAHTLGVPQTATDNCMPLEMPQHTPRPLESGGDNRTNGWEEEAVHEATAMGPAEHESGGEESQRSADPADTLVPAETVAQPEPGGAEFAALSGQPPAVPADAPPQLEKRAPTQEEERRAHLDGLLAAAAISSARLVCHKDTWAFLLEQTSRHTHFRLPDRIADVADGQIETHLSGRSLLAVLVTMQQILQDASPDQDMVTWALASAVYRRTQAAIADATLARAEGSEVTTIVLDDRPDRPASASAA
ncbi:hypothetical protein ABT121_34960 [Streptomyces sp. NPDC001928]|uniref:hypothetical protein n=1 Tax=Streptomyces sp. NPDC001928 TaxID=3154404 RepID=UPI003321CB2A